MGVEERAKAQLSLAPPWPVAALPAAFALETTAPPLTSPPPAARVAPLPPIPPAATPPPWAVNPPNPTGLPPPWPLELINEPPLTLHEATEKTSRTPPLGFYVQGTLAVILSFEPKWRVELDDILRMAPCELRDVVVACGIRVVTEAVEEQRSQKGRRRDLLRHLAPFHRGAPSADLKMKDGAVYLEQRRTPYPSRSSRYSLHGWELPLRSSMRRGVGGVAPSGARHVMAA